MRTVRWSCSRVKTRCGSGKASTNGTKGDVSDDAVIYLGTSVRVDGEYRESYFLGSVPQRRSVNAPPGRGNRAGRPALPRSCGASSRIELQHRIRAGAEDLTHADMPSVRLPPDDEGLMGTHVEDRHDGTSP